MSASGDAADVSLPDASLLDAVRLDGSSIPDVEHDGTFDALDGADVQDAAPIDSGAADSSTCVRWDPSGRPKLTVDYASFGSGNAWADATSFFKSIVRHDWLYYHTYHTYLDVGDPAPGANKQVVLKYRLDDQSHEDTYEEGEIVYINVPSQNLSCCDWQLLSATWGDGGSHTIDVTSALKRYILDCELDFYCFSGNELAGDPAPGAAKKLVISYSYNGASKSFVCNEEGNDNHISIK